MVLFGEANEEATGDVSPLTCIAGGGELEDFRGVRCRSLRIVRSALRSLFDFSDDGGWLIEPVGADAPSSASSLISFNRLDEIAGDAVWSGKTAASEVSLRPSAVLISSSVS